jgi:hypothetical protein
MSTAVTESWDVEYATGTRYTPDEPPVGFVADILAVLWLRPQSTWRDPAELGQWLQWEGIYCKA